MPADARPTAQETGVAVRDPLAPDVKHPGCPAVMSAWKGGWPDRAAARSRDRPRSDRARCQPSRQPRRRLQPDRAPGAGRGRDPDSPRPTVGARGPRRPIPAQPGKRRDSAGRQDGDDSRSTLVVRLLAHRLCPPSIAASASGEAGQALPVAARGSRGGGPWPLALDAAYRLVLRLTFGDHVDERDDSDSSSVASRVADVHVRSPTRRWRASSP